ncbi:hypothetical protein [Pseudonocardia adelaidensis]|uniref:Immunity protein 22 of polymorphic toxin system n=1 Tax=Pseudonocardia adelaidensis TaxID=648754 RepID=A0ABP9NUP4_9PSEU
MAVDINTYVEQRNPDGGWEFMTWPSYGPIGPFQRRNNTVFGFLADIRNFAGIPPVDAPRGLPPDVSDHVRAEFETWGTDGYAHSWVTVDELAAVDYHASFEILDEGTEEPSGQTATILESLGGPYFADLLLLVRRNEQHPTRVVFWFDS